MTTPYVIGTLAAIACLSLILGILVSEALKARGYRAHQLPELDWYNRTWLRKQGWSKGFGQYEMMSLDGGKNWFNVERTRDRGVIPTGPANPELIAHLANMDALAAYGWTHGPLNLGNAAHLELLSRAGFTIERQS